MNKTSVKVMIQEIEQEIGNNEDLIGKLSMRNEQLDIAARNLREWANDSQTSVNRLDPGSIAAHAAEQATAMAMDPMLEPIPAKRDIKPKKSRFSAAGLRALRKAQKLRYQREKFEKLGKTPLAKDKPARKKGKLLHWTQRPENKRKMLAHIRKMVKANAA